jgi:hypothetical protein
LTITLGYYIDTVLLPKSLIRLENAAFASFGTVLGQVVSIALA